MIERVTEQQALYYVISFYVTAPGAKGPSLLGTSGTTTPLPGQSTFELQKDLVQLALKDAGLDPSLPVLMTSFNLLPNDPYRLIPLPVTE
ncbi:hypothetical protein [Streptomyces sp. NPDC020607]|uniref:hypothetical protein n=1 Tax=Streptomyces sp. NPDC020607 TaxID=3365082 RepID=UPI00379540A5